MPAPAGSNLLAGRLPWLSGHVFRCGLSFVVDSHGRGLFGLPRHDNYARGVDPVPLGKRQLPYIQFAAMEREKRKRRRRRRMEEHPVDP